MAEFRDLLPAGVTVFERGWLSSNNILIVGKQSTSLVDSGYVTHSDQTLALVATGSQGRPLDRLLNTHLHSDHCGGNAALQVKYPSLRTLIPPGQADLVNRWDPVALSYEPTGQECPRFRFDALLEPGHSVEVGDLSWEVHSAPGHDPNSVILFEPQSRALLSADALWENGFGIVFQELEGEQAFDEVAATLDLIESLDPAVVVPGHGAVFADAASALAKARSRLAAYRAQPERHAAHAAKVLLKFKLLEWQQADRSAFFSWAQRTPYFQMVQRRWFPNADLAEWLDQLLADLVRSGAARLEGGRVLNS
jgi:glyoxylase-like metal-dependent hydrolase (beta-lactamase superfamily II)